MEIDDAYLGGERSGGKPGRDSDNKVPFVAAVQTTENCNPIVVCMSAQPHTIEEVGAFAAAHIATTATVISDALWCFRATALVGAEHRRIVAGGGKASVDKPEFKAINTLLGNLKMAITGTYHAFDFASTPTATSPSSDSASTDDSTCAPSSIAPCVRCYGLRPLRNPSRRSGAAGRGGRAMGTLSGLATACVLRRQRDVFGDTRFERLGSISVGHLYNLRNGAGYRAQPVVLTKTRGDKAVAIGLRKAPAPEGFQMRFEPGAAWIGGASVGALLRLVPSQDRRRPPAASPAWP